MPELGWKYGYETVLVDMAAGVRRAMAGLQAVGLAVGNGDSASNSQQTNKDVDA
jgi:hypothetical protein